MTLQWTLVALFLYAEVLFLALLMLTWIRPPIWKKIFHSRLIKALELYSNIFYYAFGGILLLLFFDALREVKKYGVGSIPITEMYQMPHADTMIHMRLFRAQRNAYIAGFALFLYLVCRRMVQLIITQANLMASSEAALKQARSASQAAQGLLDKQEKSADDAAKTTKDDEAFEKLKSEIVALQKELVSVKKDREAMKEQAEGVKREYDRAMKEAIDNKEKNDKKVD